MEIKIGDRLRLYQKSDYIIENMFFATDDNNYWQCYVSLRDLSNNKLTKYPTWLVKPSIESRDLYKVEDEESVIRYKNAFGLLNKIFEA